MRPHHHGIWIGTWQLTREALARGGGEDEGDWVRVWWCCVKISGEIGVAAGLQDDLVRRNVVEAVSAVRRVKIWRL